MLKSKNQDIKNGSNQGSILPLTSEEFDVKSKLKTETFEDESNENISLVKKKKPRLRREHTRVRLSLQEKVRIIEESKKPEFDRSLVISKYGFNKHTLVRILQQEDEIMNLIESGKGHKTNFGRIMSRKTATTDQNNV